MADRIVCMKDGLIEQVGTPSELYNQPKTSFVANFLGSMNELDVLLEHDNKLLTNLKLEKGYSIGIRPEAVVILDAKNQDKTNSYQARVTKIENLGSASHIQTVIDKVTILIEQNGFTDYKVGDELMIHFPLEKIISFAHSVN
jgi:ABC-type sugar transport system ATPase subunit